MLPAMESLKHAVGGGGGKYFCSGCGDVMANRIPGWPILNATATCGTNPNTWLFGAQGECCASGEEPFQLARWVGQMCNGSEWRSVFSFYAGMAREDWEEYILPWNRTVSPVDLKLNGQELCSDTAWYLGTFFVENLIYLAFAITFCIVRLSLIKKQERDYARAAGRVASPPTGSKFGIQHLLWFRNNDSQEAIQPSRLTKSILGAYIPIIVGVLLAAAQVGVNMGSAAIIQRSPEYENVNVGYLGLLFCIRPRLTWFACLLGLLRERIPNKYFRFPFTGTAARAILASVAVSSKVSKGIMQVIGIYYMAITANYGREKGFYDVNNLIPYWRGTYALYMCVGALIWLIACVLIILIGH